MVTITPRLRLLEALFKSATENASEAMSRWTNGQIALYLEDLREIPLEDVATESNVDDELMTMVVHHLDDDQGQFIVAFDDENGRQLAASLLGRDAGTDPTWGALEISALNETGNILSCAYMKVLTDVIGKNLVPSPPNFLQDYGVTMLEQAAMAQAMVSDQILISRTVFTRNGQSLDWNIFFVPTNELLATLENALAETV